MTRVGRNEPCPCGSGKKYKRCCLEGDERERLEHPLVLAGPTREQRASPGELLRAVAHHLEPDLGWTDELQERFDEAQELFDAGEFDEADEMCGTLEADAPDEPNVVELRAQLHEARGAQEAAVAAYRRAVAIMDELGEGHYCDCCRARMVKAVWRLDPHGPALELGRDPQ